MKKLQLKKDVIASLEKSAMQSVKGGGEANTTIPPVPVSFNNCQTINAACLPTRPAACNTQACQTKASPCVVTPTSPCQTGACQITAKC